MKMRRKAIVGVLAIVLASCLVGSGERICAEGLNTMGTVSCIVGYIIPVFPIYSFYKFLSNKKLACAAVLGWAILSASAYWPEFELLRFLGGIITAIVGIAALEVRQTRETAEQ